MGLTNERKVFFGALALAATALIIDQGFLAPSGAAGMETAPADQTQPQPQVAPQAADQGAELSPARTLISRIQDHGNAPADASLGTAFSLGQLITPSGAPDTQTVSADQPDPAPALPVIDPPAPDLPNLTAVMPAKDGGGAVLNGRLIRIGQTDPNGFVLMQVRERGVVLKRDGRLYTLEIPTPRGS